MRGRGVRVASRRPSALALGAVVLAVGLAGCGGGGSGPAVNAPVIGAARQFTLGGFQPAGNIAPDRPVDVSFTVRMPDGKPLTSYRTGSGPHTGVHLIIVRDDLAYIIHEHPPVGPGGLLRQTVTFPAPGQYHVLVDTYPRLPGVLANFQLFTNVTVRGAYHPRPLPRFRAVQDIGGYRIAMSGPPALHADQAQFVDVTVTDPRGRPVTFVPWFGALAHAIFFHAGSLDYFHTHVCGAAAVNCTSTLGGAKVSGTSTAPGRLNIGVLIPVPGTWELFLQMQLGGRIITAPFTLRVAS